MKDKLEKLVELGVNAIWIAPCFDSPDVDNGSDVRDYRKIMPDSSTMVRERTFRFFPSEAINCQAICPSSCIPYGYKNHIS
ncbi:alpha-amylase family glycosyl hydrolase [Zymomonas mobilis]|uniref:alpha-amylase family glycosyl hydrolase n=1 Tax=Zymomonas mobilis TaxID=542 RepID=UPI0039E7F057